MSPFNFSIAASGDDGKGRKWRTESRPSITKEYFEGREVAKTPYFPGESLEQYIEKDETFRGKHDRPITLNRCPIFLREVIVSLQSKRQQLQTMADVTRRTSDCGIGLLERLEAPGKLKSLRRQIFLQQNETLLAAFSELKITPMEQSVSRTCRFSAYVYHDVRGRIFDFQTVTGLTLSCCTELALIAGLSQSDTLVPVRYKKMFVAGLREFVVKIERRVMEMHELIHKKA